MRILKAILVVSIFMIGAIGCDADEVFDAQEQLEIDDAIIRAYLEENDLLNDVLLDTASNIYYIIHEQGTGEKPKFGSTVIAHYEGSLLEDGEVFDSSLDREPLSFVLGRSGREGVIDGWNIGFSLIEKGTHATFYLPSGLGYGTNGTSGFGAIPANANLIFEVTLIDIR